MNCWRIVRNSNERNSGFGQSLLALPFFLDFLPESRVHLLVFSTGSLAGGFFSMKVCRIKKSENNGNARLSMRIHYREDTNKNVFNSQ